MPPPERHKTPASSLAVHGTLIAVQIAFASLPIAGKLAMRGMPPGALAFGRTAGAAAIFIALHLAQGGTLRLPGRDLARIALYSMLGVAGNQLLFLSGLQRTTAINASLVTTTIPVFTALIAVALGRERATAALVGGIGLAAAGVLHLIGLHNFSLGGGTALGDALVITNCFCYATYLVLVRDTIARHGATTVIALAFAFGALFTAPFGAPALVERYATFDPETKLALLYAVLVPTVFTYLANAWSLQYASASVVAVYIYLQPIVAVGLAVAILGERPSERALFAAAMVFAGVGLVTLGARRALR